MGKIDFRPGNMLYPVPAVMVSCGTCSGESNIITIAWAGTVCSDPPMVSISVRPERHSWQMIRETGEFVINLVTEELTEAMDTCGVRSGKDVDKWELCHLTKGSADKVDCPVIEESPVQLECRVVSETDLGSHHMFVARVEAVHVDETLIDEKGRLNLEKARLVAYAHGTYHVLGKRLGTFGFSVRKKKKAAGKGRKRTGSTGMRVRKES